VRRAASEGLLAFVEKEGARLGRETGGCLVVTEIMLYAEGGGWQLFSLHFSISSFLFLQFSGSTYFICSFIDGILYYIINR